MQPPDVIPAFGPAFDPAVVLASAPASAHPASALPVP
jgi:hypothetical protein